MSERFAPNFVHALARRFGIDDRDALAAVLERAAQAHDAALGWRRVVHGLKAHRAPLRSFAKRVGTLLGAWDTLPDTTRRHLGYVALLHRPETRRRYGRDGARNLTAEQLAAQFRESIALLQDVATRASSERFDSLRGNPGKSREDPDVPLDGLHAFAVTMKPFWKRAVGTPFSHDAREYTGAGRRPKAPDFLLACADHLGGGNPLYTSANCDSVLKNLNRKKAQR